MKNHFKTISAFLILMVLIFNGSCKKDILNTNPDFEGQWLALNTCSSYATNLIIDNESNGKYFRCCSEECRFERSGKVKIKGNHIYVGTKKLKVIQEPFTIDTVELDPSIVSSGSIGDYSVMKMRIVEASLFKEDNLEHDYFKIAHR